MSSESISTCVRILLLGMLLSCIGHGSIAAAQHGTTDGQWPTYGGDKGSTKYSPLDQIDRSNFGDLEVAWQWESIDAEVVATGKLRGSPGSFKSTPVPR
jgi:quinoprotein glucose dehydrogenase